LRERGWFPAAKLADYLPSEEGIAVNSTAPMPTVYLPHGGGPAFFMDGPMGEMFAPMAEFLGSFDTLLPRTPTAILVVTAHWEAPVVTVTGGSSPELIFDYYGFPRETYELTYGAPGSPALAQQAATLLNAAGIDVTIDPGYGWDHGVFIPLKVMYPEAQIPVVAMSLRVGLDPSTHSAVGEALRPLRDQDVLIMGSGMSFHNLQRMANGARDSEVFDGWLDDVLVGDATQRAKYLSEWSTAPAGRASHPREEHLLPLMVASGAGSDQPGTKMWSGSVGDTRVAAWAFN
jgi:aromatic ring-opening dioxygenase catalytic subunit (LigB family)